MRAPGHLLVIIASLVLVIGGGCSGQSSTGMPVPAHADALIAPRDAAVGPDLACVPDQGPGCCYPTCQPDEALVCLGDNICGYPCHCEKRGDGFMSPDLACVPNQGPGCCYPTCLPGQVLSCLGANIC